MKRQAARIVYIVVFLFVILCLWGRKEIQAEAADPMENEKSESVNEDDIKAYMEGLEFDDIDKELEELFPDEKMDFGVKSFLCR